MNLDQLFKRFEGAFAENTLRAYRSDFQHFQKWCKSNRLDVTNVQPDEFADYIEFLSQTLKSATIRRRVTSIASVLNLSGLNNPVNSLDAKLAMKKMHRRKGRAQEQATPLTRNILDQLIAVCDDSIFGIRNEVLLRLGYETMRRRSELCQFTFENQIVSPTGKHGLFLPYSKTDQFGQGKIITISDELFYKLEIWKQHKHIAGKGPILRHIYKNGRVGKKLNPASINVIIKDLQKKANVNLQKNLSGHSFRIGAAIDLLEQGESMEKIMLRGGWKTESTAIRYLRAWHA